MILSNTLDKAGLRAHINTMSNEQQARKDAMADAATLHANRTLDSYTGWLLQQDVKAYGTQAVRYAEVDPSVSANSARRAAHAAFQVVPALRDGK